MKHWLSAIGMVFLCAACGSQTEATKPSPSTGSTARITLSETSCAYDGPRAIQAGPLTLTAVNSTSDVFSVEILLIPGTHTYDELLHRIAEDSARIKAGQLPIGPPDWASVVCSKEIEGTHTDALSASLIAGGYAIVCGRIHSGAPLGVFAGASLTVSA